MGVQSVCRCGSQIETGATRSLSQSGNLEPEPFGRDMERPEATTIVLASGPRSAVNPLRRRSGAKPLHSAA
jgi:hypothetical protein